MAYVWHGALHATTVAESLAACGFEIRAQIVWAKDRLVLGRGHYHWQHEPCWYAVRGAGHWMGDRKTTLWQIASTGLFQMATQGQNVAAAIFWMKVRGGWSEKLRPDPPGVEGAPKKFTIVIGSPREEDPELIGE